MDGFGFAGGALSLVAVSENVTFRVDAPDGDAYVLRLHRPAITRSPSWTRSVPGPRRSQARGWQCPAA